MNPSEIELGPLDAYPELPAEVTIDHTPIGLSVRPKPKAGFVCCSRSVRMREEKSAP